jgi:hypothetical protein
LQPVNSRIPGRKPVDDIFFGAHLTDDALFVKLLRGSGAPRKVNRGELLLLDETEPARLPRIHDVAIPEVSFIDRKGRAVSRTPKIDAAEGHPLHPAEQWARKQHVAAGSGPMAFPHPSGEARLDVLRSKMD